MRVAALAPVAALLVAVANAAPVPVADPFAFCFFGFGIGCDNTPTTTSVAAVKTTSSSILASSVKVTSTSAMATSTSKAASSTPVSSVKSSSVASATSTKAATTTQSVANWSWLWDPTYVFNMWNNFLTFRWEKYNDCNFNGYSLTYVKAYYYNTYGFKPLTGCQWKDVYTFLDKYAVKNSVKPANNAIFTPGCANPFGGADANWKPTTNVASSAQVSSSAAPSSSAKVSSSVASASASALASSSKAISSSAVQSPAASSPAASNSAASSPAVSSPAASSPAASSPAASAPVVPSPAASSPAAQSIAAQSAAASSPAVQSSIASSASPSATDNSAASASATNSATNSATDSNSASGSDSVSGTATASAATVTPTSYGTPVTFSNGQTAQYLGCVAEIDGRKFTKASIDDSTVMTNEYCSSYCSALGFPVAGTEYAKECYCATYDQIATYTTSDQCVMPCSADATGQSICGGPQALSVYVNPSAVRTVSFPTNWAAQGCFQDNNDRVLTYQAWSGNTGTTVESCAAQCASSGYNIAGVEYGTECYCGNSFVGGAVALASSSCNMPCPGNGGESCGGSWAMSVASLVGSF